MIGLVMKRWVAILLFCCLMLPFAAAQTKKSTARTTSKSRTTVTQKRTTPVKKTTTKSSAKTTTKRATTTTRKTGTTKNTKETTSISSLRSRRSALQQELRKDESQLATTNKNVKKELNDLAIINGKIEKQKKYISEIQTEIDSLTRNITGLKKEHRTLSKQLEARKQKYNESMKYIYKHYKDENKLLFVLSGKSFTEMLRRYRFVKDYAEYQRKQGDMLKAKKKQVNEVKENLEKTQSHKNEALTARKNENEELSRQQGERQKTVNSLQRKQQQIRSTIATKKKEMAALDAKIDYYVKLAIEQERKRREAAERARKEAEIRAAQEAARKKDAESGKSSSGSSSSGSGNVAPKPAPVQKWQSNDREYALTKNFTSNKGRLPMPITGSYIISAHFGNYNLSGVNGVQLSNKGINITGQSGACARCIFPGEVSAVFSLGGMVNVLVRHGSYISVYCNLASASVRQGQHVEARTILGSVARDTSGKCTLHFQLRKETATLNPEPWLAR